MRTAWGFFLLTSAIAGAQSVSAVRAPENPLISVTSSPTVGDNVNGPSVIRVPSWVQNPLGRYYMYFAHHKGQFIRLAYADSLRGPWKIYEPGVMKVSESAFFREQPDPEPSPSGVYTHIASPEVYIDEANKRIVMWTHGVWTEGKRWPAPLQEATAFMRANGYGQYTQGAVSTDGLNFKSEPAISRQSYLRVFQHNGEFFGISRLGQLLRAKEPKNPLSEFELGMSPFRDSPYAGRVRHVALLVRGDVMHVFFSAIRDAPEGILYTTIPLKGDWSQWKATAYTQVLTPEAKYECPEMATAPSEVGEIYGPAKQLRDPAIFEENGKLYLFYTVCGEQGVGMAEVTLK